MKERKGFERWQSDQQLSKIKYHSGGLLQYIRDNPLPPSYESVDSKFIWNDFIPKFKKKENKMITWLKKKLGINLLEEIIRKQNEEINELRRRINDGAYMSNVYHYYGEAPSVKTIMELILDHLKLSPTFKSCESHYELKPYPNKNAKTNTTKRVRKVSTRKK